MPWEVSLRRIDDSPLGEVSLVCKGLEAALPETQFYREPSGKEKMEAAIARGVEFPDAIRAIFEHQLAKIQAHYQADDLVIVFYGFESDPLQQLHAEIRGNGNPVEALLRVCEQNAWKAIDDSTDKIMNSQESILEGWQSFVGYRERGGGPTTDASAGKSS